MVFPLLPASASPAPPSPHVGLSLGDAYKGGNKGMRNRPHIEALRGRYVFALAACLLYGILFCLTPDRTLQALVSSMRIFGYVLPPLAVAFMLMILLNLLFRASQVTRLLGQEAGFTGVLLSAAAGIISMGPIYAWYPLLKEVREKGAGNIAIAVFLGNRSVKPFLLPMMLSYFGWRYVVIVTCFMIMASIAVGYLVDILCTHGKKP